MRKNLSRGRDRNIIYYENFSIMIENNALIDITSILFLLIQTKAKHIFQFDLNGKNIIQIL